MIDSGSVISADAFRCYMTGIKEVDEQHWNLIILETEINTLARAGKKREAYDKIAPLRTALLRHFEDEENLMRKIGFPFVEVHIEEHKKIVKVLEGVQQIFLKSSDYNKECFTPVYGVMHSHLDNSDFQIVPYYQKWVKENEGSS